MKQNLFNKVWLRIGIIVAVMTSAFAGTALAGTELYYSLEPTAVSGGNTNYNGNGNATIDGIQWNVQGVINTIPWRIGGRSLNNAGRNVSSLTAIPQIINEVKLSLGNIEAGWGSFTVNSLTLTVASDANFTNVVDTKQITSVSANSTPTFNGSWPAGSYYRFTFSITTGGIFGIETSDKYIEFSKVEFKGPYVETPVISGTQVFEESTQVTITCPAPDADATIQYTLDGGVNWYDYSAPFTLTQTTTVIAKATKEGKNDSHEATKTFCQEGDLQEVDWDLTKAPTGSSNQTQVTWTTSTSGAHFANMTLARNGNNNTAANNYLGNGGNRNHTRFNQNQLLTIAPEPGFEIAYVEFICQTGYTGGLNGTWTNATASVSGNTVTVTPTDLTAAFSRTISAQTRVTGVNVHYFPITTPYIAMKDSPINVTSAAADGTLEVSYQDVDKTSAQVQVIDGNNQSVDWLHITANSDNTELSYSIDANTSTESRTAYIIVKSGNYSSNRITVTQEAAIVLYNSQENTSTITNNDGKTCCVILDGRSFSPGKWYTLCLPFNVTIANSPLAGADARALDTDYTRIESKSLKLEFTSVTELEAGMPYIIRWESGSNIVNPVFENVTISKATPEVVCDLGNSRGIQFVGTYDPKTYEEVDQSKLFISNNTFYYVGVNTTIGAQRAYFQLIGFIYNGTGTDSSGGVKELGITFIDDDPTSIENVNVNLNDNDAIYNLAGQRVGKMQKGINIVNGKNIIVK